MHGIISICKSLGKTGFVEGKVISFSVKLCLGCLEIVFVVKTAFVVPKPSSYQPAVLITRGTEKIKFIVLLKMAVQQVVA